MPIIIITAAADKMLISKVVKYRPMDIITKPFTDLEFLEKVLKHKRAPVYDQIEVPNKNSQNITSHMDHDNQVIEYGLLVWNDAHKILHDNFKNQVLSICDAHLDAPVSNHDLIKLNLFIKDWLIHHILVEDKKMKQ